MKYLVDEQTARAEFDRFLEAMDIDANPKYMDDEDRATFHKQSARITRAIQSGAVMINEDGEAVFTPKNPKSSTQESLTFHERTGASLMASDGKKKGHDAAKTYAMMADLCKTHPSTFSGLVGSDIKICEALFVLLMD